MREESSSQPLATVDTHAQAVEALEQGRYTKAAAFFDKLLSHQPSSALHFQRASAAMFLDDVETAAGPHWSSDLDRGSQAIRGQPLSLLAERPPSETQPLWRCAVRLSHWLYPALMDRKPLKSTSAL